ncbi:hypothetical protein QAD02_016852 [Eretmocerus hayati]|uniref:Uncharacterized protein n=1 Tax=Eretmocerus hayati TaxID=131215 RepID=A0ACC2PCC4_9HYME|nr:hypothetical protein QAD02_016852 [Eretmocerus hayati]
MSRACGCFGRCEWSSFGQKLCNRYSSLLPSSCSFRLSMCRACKRDEACIALKQLFSVATRSEKRTARYRSPATPYLEASITSIAAKASGSVIGELEMFTSIVVSPDGSLVVVAAPRRHSF